MKNVIAHLQALHCNKALHPTKNPLKIYQEPLNTESDVSLLTPVTEDSSNLPNDAAYTSITHPLSMTPSHHIPKAAIRLMQKTWITVPPPLSTLRVHIDGGANRSITNRHEHLLSYRNIKKYPMSGVAAGDAALVCTGIGYLPWQADSGEIILVKC
jgi:hypothetical protein